MLDQGKKSKAIIFVLPVLSAGGAERVIINVANGLSDNARIYIAEIRKGGSLSELVKNNVTILSLTSKFLWLFRIIWYAHKIKPCCLVATSFDINASLLAVKWLLPKSCALVIREPVSVYATRTESKFPVIRFLVFRYWYRFANTLVLLSNEMKDEFIQLCPKIASKIKVVSNGVHMSRMNNIDGVTKDCEYKNYLITVCRLEYQKGLDILIAAFSKIVKQYPDYKLLLVGEGSQKENLLKQIAATNLEESVKLLGFIDNPSWLVKGAKLFVLPSRYEGMSNSMLEALCLGVPVLAVKNHTSAAEVIQEDVTGFLVDECNIQMIGDALLRALTRVETLNREHISQWACSEFSITKMIEDYENVFGQYCGAPNELC